MQRPLVHETAEDALEEMEDFAAKNPENSEDTSSSSDEAARVTERYVGVARTLSGNRIFDNNGRGSGA